jgi:hypothetical protein
MTPLMLSGTVVLGPTVHCGNDKRIDEASGSTIWHATVSVDELVFAYDRVTSTNVGAACERVAVKPLVELNPRPAGPTREVPVPQLKVGLVPVAGPYNVFVLVSR